MSGTRALAALAAALLFLWTGAVPTSHAAEPPDGARARLEEIFTLRARALLTDHRAGSIESHYQANRSRARWALEHEQAKITFVQQWATGRGVRIVEAAPTLSVKFLNGDETKARFYVGQSLALAYQYPGDVQVNRFGVGSRHIIEMVRQGDQWLIGMEWYSDPLGSEREVPAAAPAPEGSVPAARRGYDRDGVARYADKYCGLAAGCGNGNRYNTRFRDYSGDGGNCANFASQALRMGGGLRVPTIIRSDRLVGYLVGSGRAGVAYRGRFAPQWKEQLKSGRFPGLVQKGDLVAYQYAGKLEHVAIVTGTDSRGYPVVNSHTLDRYRAPFDLGWDRKTVFWLLQVRG